MGCDGGTIPKRDELVRMKKKPEQKDKEAELSFKWRHCALSQQVLQEPISACGLGRLYSKSSVIESLLDKANMPESAKHIRNLKDIKDLKLTKNPAFQVNAEKTEGAIDERGSPYICPVIGIEMSGRFRFIFIWSCGCVMSERAFKEVKMKLCHLCMEPFNETDVVVINGGDEDMELMKANMAIRQANSKVSKKGKSKAKVATEIPVKETPTEEASKEITVTPEPVVGSEPSSSKLEIPLELPKKITMDIAKSNKRSCTSKMQDPVYKKAKDGYSVAKDPKATDVYKSLFTSHQSDKNQKRAHWITYNPFYN